MADEEYRPPLKDVLDMLAETLAERYFERMNERMKKIPELRRLVNAKEASQYLSLSTDTIYHMASQKKLPYLKIGDRVLFDIKALDQWIERHLVREKEWKRQELKTEVDERRSKGKPSKEANLLDLLGQKGKSSQD